MPSIPELTDGDGPAFGWFGKHPAHGDFVSRGVAEPLRDMFQDWLDGALSLWRAEAGDGWGDAFDDSARIRFWLGGAILGQGRCGILMPARDRIGRRYPLIVWSAGRNLPPPLDPDQAEYEALDGILDDLCANADRPVPGDAMPPPVDDLLWATNAAGATDTLLADIAAEDMCRAAQTRSYWWVPGNADDPARVATVTGLPDGTVLGWLATGGDVADEDAEDDG